VDQIYKEKRKTEINLNYKERLIQKKLYLTKIVKPVSFRNQSGGGALEPESGLNSQSLQKGGD